VEHLYWARFVEDFLNKSGFVMFIGVKIGLFLAGLEEFVGLVLLLFVLLFVLVGLVLNMFGLFRGDLVLLPVF